LRKRPEGNIPDASRSAHPEKHQDNQDSGHGRRPITSQGVHRAGILDERWIVDNPAFLLDALRQIFKESERFADCENR
jgi:hypothetical protein